LGLEDSIARNLIHWVSGKGPEDDIVLSSRIRLARNLSKYSFPNKAGKEDKKKVRKAVAEAVLSQNTVKLHYINLADLPELEREVLIEKHLISPLLAQKGMEKGVFLDDNEKVSVMINEEDHIRIQILSPGFQLDENWKMADEFDDVLEKNLDYSFSEKWGYLTSCPTNVGTGLRASVMLHLPVLSLTNNIKKMLEAVSKLGLAVRGIYGEGSEVAGNIYQISNQVTLGHSEIDIIDNLESVTEKIIEQERKARESLLQEKSIELRDTISRSYGTLKYAYRISSEEALRLLSNVKLGSDLGLLKQVDRRVMSELMILIRPAHVQKIHGQELNTIERDIKRAELIQTRLKM